MSLDLHSEIDQLRERITRLEQTQRRPRGRTNQAGAARYLGIAEETSATATLAAKGLAVADPAHATGPIPTTISTGTPRSEPPEMENADSHFGVGVCTSTEAAG